MIPMNDNDFTVTVIALVALFIFTFFTLWSAFNDDGYIPDTVHQLEQFNECLTKHTTHDCYTKIYGDEQ
jgi:hypothetical protein